MLDAEIEAKIGYSKNERTDNNNYRNGHYPERTVATEMGDIPEKVPRDRNGEIDSDLVPKYSRTANGFDEKVISMYALGMSDKDIQEQIKETFGCNLSPDMISDITDKIIPEVQEWQKRKLESVYPIVFIDATHFHVRDNVFPTDMSLLKVLYLSTLKAEKKWSRMVDKWDLCLSQFRIMYEGRI